MKGIYDCFACGVTVYQYSYRENPDDLILWSTREPDGLYCFDCFLNYWHNEIGRNNVDDILSYVNSIINGLVDEHFEEDPQDYYSRDTVKNEIFQREVIGRLWIKRQIVAPYLKESHRILESLFK